MKDYREMAREALRRRDAYIARRDKAVKRLAATAAVVAVCLLAGTASVYVALNFAKSPPELSYTEGTSDSITSAPLGNTGPQTTWDTADSESQGDVSDRATSDTVDTEEPAASTDVNIAPIVTEDTESDPASDNNGTDGTREPSTTLDEPHSSETPIPSDTDPDVTDKPDDSGDTTATSPVPSDTQQTEPAPSDGTTSTTGEDTTESDTEEPDLPPANNDSDVLYPPVLDPTPSLPPIPGRFAEHGERDPHRYQLETPSKKGDMSLMGSSSGGETADPSVLYYAIDFLHGQHLFIDGVYPMPSEIPIYTVLSRPDLAYELERFVKILYGSEAGEAGEMREEYSYPLFNTSDDGIAYLDEGRYISAGSGDRLYFTVDLWGRAGDMTANEALEFIKASKYYAAAEQYLGIQDAYVATKKYTYYNGDTYEYIFTFSRSSDILAESAVMSTVGSLEVRVIFAEGRGALRAEYKINCPADMRITDFVAAKDFYSAAIEYLKRYEGDELFEAYGEALRIMLTYQRTVKNGVVEYIPHYRYYMGYLDTDGTESYYLTKAEE